MGIKHDRTQSNLAGMYGRWSYESPRQQDTVR